MKSGPARRIVVGKGTLVVNIHRVWPAASMMVLATTKLSA